MSGWGAPAASGLFPGPGFGAPAAPVDEEAVIEDEGGAAITPWRGESLAMNGSRWLSIQMTTPPWRESHRDGPEK